MLEFEHAATASIAAGSSLADGLDILIGGAQELAEDGMRACVLLLDDTDRFVAVAGPGLNADYRAVLQQSRVGDGNNPFGAAAFAGAPVLSGDIAQDQSWTQGRKDALLHGFRACWVTPIFGAKGKILGVLAWLFSLPKRPTQVDTDLLNVCARGCAHVIERHRCERSVSDSADHFRHAFELNAQVLWTSRPDGQLDYVANRWREWTGTSGLGGSWGEAMHPDDLQRSIDTWRRAVESGEPYDIEHRVRMIDGRYCWMRSRAFCRRDDRGAIVQWYGSTEDIHEHWVARSALLESEAEFRTLAKAMPNQAWLARADGALYWFNDRVYEYTGAAPGQLDGEAWAAVVHGDDVAGAVQSWMASLAGGHDYETQFRLRDASGQYRWFLARAVAVRDERGHVARWVGTNTDVQEQRNVSDKLSYLNSSLEIEVANRTADRDRMWRLSTDIMMVADFGGMIIAVNPAWSSILDVPADQSVGRDFLECIHPDDRSATTREVARLEQGLTTLRFENRYRHRNGSYRWISWTAVPAQELIHAIGRDVTDEKEARAALARSEQALLQSQKLESIGKLTGGVAHDFNNVLQIISGNLQLLQLAVGDNPLAVKRLDTLAAAVDRGAKLSSQLLAFARRQPLKPLVTDVGRLLRSMAELLRRAIGETIDVELVVGGGLWHTLVDPNQLENVLLNIAINARDAMDGQGKLTVEVGNAMLDDAYASRHADLEPGQYVLLAMSDTGHGMSPDIIGKIFEPFFTTKKEGEGTGLGLSMAYGFVRQSGGHIKVYSEPGHGTTFKIYLPRAFETEADVPVSLTGPVLGGKETILVVEDDLQVQATVVDMLRGLGYAVLKANDGQSALTVLNSGVPIDLLFTDVVMPGDLRSPELARQAMLLLPDLAVLFTSGYTQNAIVHGGRLDAGVELLSKPYRREDLARKVRHVLANVQHANGLRLAARASPGPFTEPPARGGRCVLLVEDNPDALDMTAELLRMLGHRVLTAASGEEALALLDAEGLEVLLTDVTLPQMSGIELAAQARGHVPHLTVIFATGHDQGKLGIPEGSALFLQKPFSVAQLEQALSGKR
ncbi:MAG: PAS domain-containing protein [Pseudomonadota bacterium]